MKQKTPNFLVILLHLLLSVLLWLFDSLVSLV